MTGLHSIAAAPEWLIASRMDKKLLEGVINEPWDVSHCTATRGVPHTDFGNNRLAVPSGGSDLSRVVRHHELLHVLLSPSNVPEEYVKEVGLSARSVHLAEEIRINTILGENAKGLGLKISALKDGSEINEAKNAVASNDLDHAIHLMCASIATGSEASVSRILFAQFPELKKIKSVLKKTIRKNWQKNSTQISFVHSNGKGAVEATPHPIPRGFQATLILAQIIEALMRNDGEDEGEYRDRVKAQSDNMIPSTNGENPWGALVFGSVPLNESGSGFLSRTRTASATGRQPRRLHRLISDPERKVFDRIARKRGGIVIVDGSGSMSLDEEDLKEIVKAASGCLVAVYSFRYEPNEPNIWVVANNGRFVSQDEFPPIGCDNVVDLPALEWGVRQRKDRKDPVIWVSDGQVTGISRHPSDDLEQACARFIAKNKIIQVKNAKGAVDILNEFAKGKTPHSPQFYGNVKQGAKRLKLID